MKPPKRPYITIHGRCPYCDGSGLAKKGYCKRCLGDGLAHMAIPVHALLAYLRIRPENDDSKGGTS